MKNRRILTLLQIKTKSDNIRKMYLTLRNYISTLISNLVIHCHGDSRAIFTCKFVCAYETYIFHLMLWYHDLTGLKHRYLHYFRHIDLLNHIKMMMIMLITPQSPSDTQGIAQAVKNARRVGSALRHMNMTHCAPHNMETHITSTRLMQMYLRKLQNTMLAVNITL